MSCKKCTETPKFPNGKLKVYINASHSYILDKIYDTVADFVEESENFGGQVSFITDDFKGFVDKCKSDNRYSSMEYQNINILTLSVDESFDFGKASQAKTLESWITLMNSQDLVWILDNGSITIYFQPIVDAQSMEIHAYECLARGVLKDGSLMNPKDMFDTAKKTGMLFNLDRQCRETAIKTAAVKNINKNIFINFIPSAIYNPEFCLKDTVKWASQLEFDPSTIVFEVVETEKVEDTEHLLGILKYYKDKGFKTALDDVGSGYSSLNMLAKIKPDVIKIDLELVRDVDTSEVKQSIVKAIISMAKEIGLKVLAEGIETDSERDWFDRIGVDYMQGYFFGKPSPEPIRELS